jgi:3-oxoacyl-[acyl-carrier-protein] synthase-1
VSVPIVAVGARTPLGYQAAPSAAAVRCGLANFQDHPFMVDAFGNPIKSALDDGLEPAKLGAIRLLTLARSALEEAMSELRLDSQPALRFDVLLSLPEARPGFTDMNAAWIARELSRGLSPKAAELAPRGHAGALDALRHAAQRIDDGQADLCAIVGVDSYFSPDTIDWLGDNRRLAGEGNRDGFIPGEAAGCVVVASSYARGALQLPELALVRGVHSARESSVISGTEEVFGHGLAEAILGATASLQLPTEAIDDVYGDINGERYRTDEWCFAILRTNHVLRSVQYQIPASCWGDVGAASGALGCILAVRAWANDYAKGPRALVWGGSEAGLRSAVVLEQGRGA